MALGEYPGSGGVVCCVSGPALGVGGVVVEAADRAGPRAVGVVVCLEGPALGVRGAASVATGLAACGGA